VVWPTSGTSRRDDTHGAQWQELVNRKVAELRYQAELEVDLRPWRHGAIPSPGTIQEYVTAVQKFPLGRFEVLILAVRFRSIAFFGRQRKRYPPNIDFTVRKVFGNYARSASVLNSYRESVESFWWNYVHRQAFQRRLSENSLKIHMSFGVSFTGQSRESRGLTCKFA
jgi:hypothetical protein